MRRALLLGSLVVLAPALAHADCGAAIARYKAVQANDVATGNVNRAVAAQIKREIDAAEAACSAGQDGKAMELLRASQTRHGYSTGL